MSQCTKFLVSSILLSINAWCYIAACALGQSVESLTFSHLERTKLYNGLCFEYTSVEKKGDGQELVLENELSIFAPLDARSSQMRRMWICKRKNPGEPWDPDDKFLVHYFCGFDGREGRYFVRTYSGENSRPSLNHSATVVVQDPLRYENNRFEEFLTGGPHMLPEYSDPRGTFVLKKSPLKLSLAGEVIWKGRRALRLVRDDGEWEVILDSETGHVPLQFSAFFDGKKVLVSEAKEVGDFEGIKYVKSGAIQSEATSDLQSEYYSFKVNRVRRVTPSDVYWPEWPLGTAASNDAGERVVHNPYPPERSDAVRRTLENKKSGSGGLRWATMTVLIVASILALYLYRRKYAN